MMRLQRFGRKNDPSFRIVVTDKRNGPRSGNAVDQVGSYHPKTKHFIIDAEKVKNWLSKGVQPSPTLNNLLISKNIIEGKKINVLPKKSPIAKEGGVEAVAPETASEATTEPADVPTEDTVEAPAEEETPTETKEESAVA